MITYIHYGSDRYESTRFKPVRNSTSKSMPQDGTGLWAGREEDFFEDGQPVYGWKKWCEDTKYRVEKLNRSFRFRLAEESNLLTLKKPADLLTLPTLVPWEWKDPGDLKLQPGEFPSMEQLHEYYRRNPCYLDYEKMLAGGVDAIELRNCHLFARCLDTWNCDCLLVLNPKVIIPVMENSDHPLIKPAGQS